jgi:hypothetical protein
MCLGSEDPSGDDGGSGEESPPSDEGSDTGSGTPVAAIAGGVAGGVAGLALIGALVFFFLRRRRDRAGTTDHYELTADDKDKPAPMYPSPVYGQQPQHGRPQYVQPAELDQYPQSNYYELPSDSRSGLETQHNGPVRPVEVPG